MKLLQSIKQAFATEQKKVKLPSADTAWSESIVYNRKDFPKYNPDDLIGKKGAGIYRKMLRDEQVKAVTRFKRDAITSRDFIFEVDTDALGEVEAERRLAISNKIVDNIKGSFTDSLNGIMSAQYQGFSLTEKVFEQLEVNGLTYWGIKALKLKPYDTFKFEVDEYSNILNVVQEIDLKTQTIKLSKFIHYVNNPDYDEHYGQSELYEAYRAYFSKDMAIKFQNIWLEKHAKGYRVITQTDESNLKADTPDYNSLIKALMSGGSMILPKGCDLDLNFPANNVAFQTSIDMYDLHIARALLVPNLMGITPAGQTGSYSQSDTQLEAFLWTLDADTKRLEETLNEQVFRQLGEINFSDDLWPRFKFNPVSDSKKMELINTWKDLVTGNAVQHTDTDETHVRELLDFPEAGEPVVKSIAPNPLMPEGEGEAKPIDKGTKPPAKKDDNSDEETIKAGVALYGADVIDNALKRVDFKVIERKTDTLEARYTPTFSKLSGDMGLDVANKLNKYSTGADIKVKDVKINASTKAKVKRAVTSMLKDAWGIGTKAASFEVDKAKGEMFTANKQRMNFVTADYVDDKAFYVAGKLTADEQAIIDNVILLGIKADSSLDEIKTNIFTTLATEGLMSEADVQLYLADALVPNPDIDLSGVLNPTARLNTLVRTNTYDAINEGRYSFFNDPSLEGFVEALEYSSILDGRTTDLCVHLDGTTHAVDDPLWGEFRPPNHFNCRALLIAITANDKWKDSMPPKLHPPSNFGGTTIQKGMPKLSDIKNAKVINFNDALNTSEEWVKSHDDDLINEYGIVIDANNNVVATIKGEGSSIYIPTSVTDDMLKNTSFIHSHPSGSSLSAQDLQSATLGLEWNSITALSVIDTTKYTVSNILFTYDGVSVFWDEVASLTSAFLQEMVFSNILTATQALIIQTDLTWEAASAMGYIDYNVYDAGVVYDEAWDTFLESDYGNSKEDILTWLVRKLKTTLEVS